MSDLDPRHGEKKRGLQSLGIGLILIGGIFTLIGFISFFSSFGSGEPPSAFWALFVGLPMLGIGSRLAGFGFLGEISRYTAGEVAPVAKDALGHIRDGATRETGIRCPQCGETNDTDAAFCDNCGTALRRKCESCGAVNDPDSRFCDNCGRQIA